jgi:2-polyprenyl-3-methyl-5-hydroxy-6-metoxy-1,4-benzoquinol methylase
LSTSGVPGREDGDVPAGGIRIDWPASEQPPYQGVCPNCGAAGDKPHVLDVAWVAPKLPQGDRKPVYVCPSCTARFYPPLKVPNYHDPDVMDWGWHQFHIQQGAGLVPITAPLGRIDRPEGTRFLEIGCGYGFGLDFAIHALGWEGMGIDPSPMARLGAADLAIEIRDGYFPQADPEARIWDVIAATEVIEHVEHPPALLAALRARLARDGVLLLTTPDGEAIRRETPEAALAQLLAPGIHMVFQTEASLRRLFAVAGFGDVVVGRDGLTLVAYAGAIAGVVTDERADHRARFRDYLAARAAAVPTGSDLGLGFAGRAMFEAVVDLDWAAARTARGLLWPAIRERFGLDLDELREVPADFFGMGLAALKDAMPLNLGMILYAEASRLRAEPVLRPQAGAMFALAGMAALALHSALAQATLNDGLAEELVWRGRRKRRSRRRGWRHPRRSGGSIICGRCRSGGVSLRRRRGGWWSNWSIRGRSIRRGRSSGGMGCWMSWMICPSWCGGMR